MTWTGLAMHFGAGMLGAVLPLALCAWVARLADRAGVQGHPQAERWLSTALMVAAGALLGWGGSSGRSGAVELSGVLVLLAAWLAWRRRLRKHAQA